MHLSIKYQTILYVNESNISIPQKTFLPKKKKHFYISLTELGFFYNYDYFYYFIHEKAFEVCFYAIFFAFMFRLRNIKFLLQKSSINSLQNTLLI